MMRQMAISGIIAIGVLCTIVIAGIDLSVGSVAAFCGVLLAQLVSHGWALPLAVAAVLGAGVAIGTLNAFADRPARHSRLHRHAGRAAGLSRPRAADRRRHDGRRTAAGHQGLRPRHLRSASRTCSGRCSWSGSRSTTCSASPAPAATSTRSARMPRRRAGRASPVQRITVTAYVLSSALAALAGILLVSRLSIASPSMANAYELQAIAAAVVGGASLFGGRGTVLGAAGRRGAFHDDGQRRRAARASIRSGRWWSRAC